MNLTDKDLLIAIYDNKDETAFKVFYDKYAKLLLNWATKHTGNRDVAADISQNFWVIFWSKAYAIKTDETGTARKYLIHYFTYRMLDYMRSSAAKTFGGDLEMEKIHKDESYLHIIEEMQVNDILDMIEDTLKNLPDLSQKIFRQIWENNQSVKETSIELGVSEKITRTHYKKVMTIVQDQTRALLQTNVKSPKTMVEILILLGLLK